MFSGFAWGQSGYKLPPKEVVDVIDAPTLPAVSISPQQNAMLLISSKPYPSIATVSQPILRIGGVRINPQLNSRQRLTEIYGLSIQNLSDGKTVKILLPEGSSLLSPTWSTDGKKIAFLRDGISGVELWVADALTGKAKVIPNVKVNDVLGQPFQWMNDNQSLLVKTVPATHIKAPVISNTPNGPAIEETSGKTAPVRTYQDLLKNQNDEKLFEYYATSQLLLVNAITNATKRIGTEGLFTDVEPSPNEKYLLIEKLTKPFSYRVAYDDFARSVEVWDMNGTSVKTIVKYGVTDDTPTYGVVKGPRSFSWQKYYDAKLIWAEALDEGDPLKKVPFRDKLMTLDAPFTASVTELLKVEHRYTGMQFTANKDEVLLTEFNRDLRWRTTYFYSLSNIEKSKQKVFDLSVNDAYKDPGSILYETKADGDRVMIQEDDWIYLSAKGASKEGDYPELNKFNLKTGEKQNIFKSKPATYEEFISFAGKGHSQIITRYQSKTEVPNLYLTELKSGTRKSLTSFKDPAPQLTGLSKELIKYQRPDGVPLSGTLYLPATYKKGDRLPLFIWAYPLEYSDAGTAGQVRGSANTFTFFRGMTPLFLVTQGYAVLMDATMPVVGSPETMNDTFIEQIVASGRAAIDKLDSLGVIDRKKVVVGGHSYGAFMTANLLAHSDDYVAGIARSGAYNRTLTPFGFQGERRSYWEAKDLYNKMSPFMFANKINEPLLLIHGEADNNPGTFPIQSERLFQAIKGNGGTARLVMLPNESHGYSARESILHTLAEMIDWCNKYTKSSTTSSK